MIKLYNEEKHIRNNISIDNNKETQVGENSRIPSKSVIYFCLHKKRCSMAAVEGKLKVVKSPQRRDISQYCTNEPRHVISYNMAF